MDKGDVLLILQCDSGHINGDLIACAKYRLEDIIREESIKIHQLQHSDMPRSTGLEEQVLKPTGNPKGRFHVLFTVYLPRKHGGSKSSFVSFLGGDWKFTHIDDFFPEHPFSPVSFASGEQQMTLSQLFHKIYIERYSYNDTPGARAKAQQHHQRMQTGHKLYVHIQQAVEKAGHLPTGITSKRMKELNETLLGLLRKKVNFGEC